MTVALFIVGEPGAGKTTLSRLLLDEPYVTTLIDDENRTKFTVSPNVVAFGHYKGETFDGADTVGYGQVDLHLTAWETKHLDKKLTLLDGDRFSHRKALDRVRAKAKTICVLLRGGEVVAARRRARSEQSEIWVKGRITKAVNFSNMFPPNDLLKIDMSLFRPVQVCAQVLNFLEEHGVVL